MNLMANTIIDVSALMIVALLYISGRNQVESDYRQLVFNKMMICMLCYISSDLVAWHIDGKVFMGSYAIQLILNTLVYLTQIIYTYLWLEYTDFWLFKSMDKLQKRRRYYRIPLYIEVIMLITNIFTGDVFRIDAFGVYSRGELYHVSLIPYYIYDVFTLFVIFREFIRANDREQKIYCLWLTSFCVTPIIAAVILVIYGSGISVISPFYALSLLIIYLFVHQKRLTEERENLARREAELRQAKFALILSQIQPHFLYNSLTVIAALCHGKAPEAEETTLDFSEYLRGNLDSMMADKPISFAKELQHTKVYLSIEKRRFDERLDIQWDIQDELFNLPALTLQPIVENAVKYGITKKERGGTLWISSCESEKRHVITVRDDGVGFSQDAAFNDNRSHRGISTVKERLKIMCGGELEIYSTLGEGTTVIISVPKEGSSK